MKLYTQAFTLPNLLWSEPMETVWQLLTTGPSVPGSKIPHLTIAHQLFAAAVVNMPRPIRPWGAITWLSGVFQISRPTIYDLGKRAAEGLERELGGRPSEAQAAVTPATKSCADMIAVTPNRVARTALRMAFPGKMAFHPMQACLETAFDQTRGLGTLSGQGVGTTAAQRCVLDSRPRCGKIRSHILPVRLFAAFVEEHGDAPTSRNVSAEEDGARTSYGQVHATIGR